MPQRPRSRERPSSPRRRNQQRRAANAENATNSPPNEQELDSESGSPQETNDVELFAPDAAADNLNIGAQRFVLTVAPKAVSAVLLDSEWVTPLCSNLNSDAVFCARCTLVRQWRSLSSYDSPMPMQPSTVLALIIILDVLTAGLPFGFYHGLGTAAFGCQARWALRSKYGIVGFPWVDLVTMALLPSCAVMQHSGELRIRSNIEVPPTLASMM